MEDKLIAGFLILLTIAATLLLLVCVVGGTINGYQSYQDSVHCKNTTGLYDCHYKSQEHTEHLKISGE